jgi:hypothetical protein
VPRARQSRRRGRTDPGALRVLPLRLGHWLGRPAWDVVTPGFELNFRYAGYDHSEGERYDDSGGAILYATPSLRIRLPFGPAERNASLRAAVQLPFGQTRLHHAQHEEEVWSLGLLLPF